MIGGGRLVFVRQAYEYAFLEIGRRPLFWGCISIFYFLCGSLVRDEWLVFLLSLLSIVLEIGIVNVSLKSVMDGHYQYKDLVTDMKKTVKCFAIILFFIPFYSCIAYIFARITGFDSIIVNVLSQTLFSILFFRFSFHFFFILAVDAGIWRSLEMSWDSIGSDRLNSFIYIALIDVGLMLPGTALDLYFGFEHGFFNNLMAPIVSSLALARIFSQIMGELSSLGD